MNRQEAKRSACGVVGRLIESYLGVGQPGADCEDGAHGWKLSDEKFLDEAFRKIQAEMERRS